MSFYTFFLARYFSIFYCKVEERPGDFHVRQVFSVRLEQPVEVAAQFGEMLL